MTVLWIALGIVALVMVTPVIVGNFLPERYVGRARAYFAKSPDQVWEALLDYDKHPMTGKMKKSVEPPPADQSPGVLPTWVEDMGHGERITVKTVEAEQPQRMIREMQSSGVPMTSKWEYRFESDEGGCWLTLDGETFIRRGSWMVPIFRFMMVVGGGVRKGLVIQMNMVGDTLGVKPRYD